MVGAPPTADGGERSPAPGIESIEAKQPPLGKCLATYSMAADTSGTTHKHDREYRETEDVSASLERSIKGVSIGASVTMGVTVRVNMSSTLTAGHDYKLYATANGNGIGWAVW